MKSLVVFASGSGTTLQYIIDAVESGVLRASISVVIVNKDNAGAIKRAISHGIPCLTFLRSNYNTRKKFDATVVKFLDNLSPDLIVLAGWMHIFTKVYTDVYGNTTINLHPALPGQFPGADGIGDAWKAFQAGKIDHTGAMVHYIVEEVDAGKVIDTVKVPIHTDDTLDSLKQRIQFHEKPLLLSAIQKCLFPMTPPVISKTYVGKVRNMHNIGNDLMVAEHSDRLSSFDRHICMIPCKGKVLTLTSAWWFNQTHHIVPNHLLHYQDNLMMLKRCDVIPLEVVVRGFITGSTKTALWTHYNAGKRTYCGIQFPEGLVKNQRLPEPVVTPTTKSDVDVPISSSEIVSQGILSADDWKYIYDAALNLFRYGTEIAAKCGLILVDTKYEFGRDSSGRILLIDEIHTCDSSRYWKLDTYEERFSNREAPDRFDKDVIRQWVRARCDPYNEPLPEIPPELIEQVSGVYQQFYEMLTGESIPERPDITLQNFVNDYVE